MKIFKLRLSNLNSLLINGLFLVLLFQMVSCKKSEPAVNYTNFKITNVKINQVPALDPNGNDWDLGGYPDIYFNMEDVNSTVLFDGSGSSYADVAQLPISWNFINAYQITNTSVTQYVTVYDKDAVTGDEPMGYVGFKMDDYKAGYPTTVTQSNGSLNVTITGTWY
jgi:hypothetical protein